MTEPEPESGPVRDRIVTLDVLRGVAVGGILVANVLGFFGIFFLAPERLAALPTAAADRVATLAEHIFVEGKFYSIFSLLFGIGFGLQLSRRGEAAVPRFRRRLAILLAIGAVHAFLLWAGDILLLYAMLGFTMPWFARRSDRSLIRWTLGLLATPTVLYVIALVLWTLAAQQPPPGDGPRSFPPAIMARLEAIGTGGIVDALIGNLIYLVGRWADLVATMRFPKVLGMFVLGLWTVRQGITLQPAEHSDTLRRWRRLGLGIGVPLNIAGTWAFEHWPYLPPSAGGLLGVVSQAIGFPLLALGYAAAIALAVAAGRQWLGHFEPVGRMALTNYLMHSVVCVILSYGFGFGLWWRIGAAPAMAIALVIVAIQIPLSRWWLTRYAYGPVEWVWRRLTYGQPVAMRRYGPPQASL
jgi:uncharacterized protein